MSDDRPDDVTGHDELSAFLDGELDPAARDAIGAQLDRSPAWREELDGVAAARAAVRGLPAVEPPADVWAAILATVEGVDDQRADDGSGDEAAHEAVVTPIARRAWRWVAAAAAVVAVVLGAAAAVPGTHRARPDVTAVVLQHGAQAARVGDPVGALVPLGTVTPPARTAP